MDRVKLGSVHGRFQPFHNGHLDYVLQAFRRADFIYVGLTKIFGAADGSGTGRESTDANPLSYWERSYLVRAALCDAGIDLSRFEITPFPIEDVTTLSLFVPKNAVCFTTIVSDWNNEKIDRLRAAGYPVEVLEISPVDNRRVTSGTHLRQLIRGGDASWMRYAPVSVCELIQKKFASRF